MRHFGRILTSVVDLSGNAERVRFIAGSGVRFVQLSGPFRRGFPARTPREMSTEHGRSHRYRTDASPPGVWFRYHTPAGVCICMLGTMPLLARPNSMQGRMGPIVSGGK
jgi:hypothetical protein